MHGVRYFRVTLPRAGKADIGAQALEEAVVPSYEHRARPAEILRSVKASLQSLAKWGRPRRLASPRCSRFIGARS